MGCHALLQELCLTQGSYLGFLHCRWILYHLSHQGRRVSTACKNQAGCPCSLGAARPGLRLGLCVLAPQLCPY